MEGNRNSEGRGLQKVEISEGMGVGACFLRSFFRELRVTLLNYQNLTAALLSKLSVILLLMIFLNKNYCFHQRSFIYRLLSNVFFTSCMINSCHQLMNKLLVIYSCTCCCITQYFVVFIVMWSCSKPSSNIILTERKK